ncbi:unnamed protein product [Urochloa humidicola]
MVLKRLMSCCCCCSAKKDEAREVGPQALNLKLRFAEMDVLLKNLEIVDMEPICASTTGLAGEQWISKIEVLCMMLLLVCYEFVSDWVLQVFYSELCYQETTYRVVCPAFYGIDSKCCRTFTL